MAWTRIIRYSIPTPSQQKFETKIIATRTGDYLLSYGKHSLRYTGEVPVVELTNNPGHAGFALSHLLPDPVFRSFPSSAFNFSSENASWIQAKKQDFRWRHLDKGLSPSQKSWLGGVISGAPNTLENATERAVRLTAIFDIGVPAMGTLGKEKNAIARSLSIVGETAGASGERLLVGRSFSAMGVRDFMISPAPMVLIRRLKGEIPYATIPTVSPAGSVTGVNAEGILVTVHPVKVFETASPGASPCPIIAEFVLKEAKDLITARRIITETPSLGAAVFLVADGKTRKWEVIERSPKQAVVRKTTAKVVTGRFATSKFADDPHVERARREQNPIAREQRGTELLARIPFITAKDMVEILRNRRGKKDAPLPLGHGKALASFPGSQNVVIDPSGLSIWVSETADSEGQFTAIDLRHALLGEGSAPAPPPSISAGDAARALSTLKQAMEHTQIRPNRI